MKKTSISHEVLLFTNTCFARRQFCERGNESTHQSHSSQLQNACWNGLILDILPDLIKAGTRDCPSYTWQVLPAGNFIEVRMGAQPFDLSHETSINPHLFHRTTLIN